MKMSLAKIHLKKLKFRPKPPLVFRNIYPQLADENVFTKKKKNSNFFCGGGRTRNKPAAGGQPAAGGPSDELGDAEPLLRREAETASPVGSDRRFDVLITSYEVLREDIGWLRRIPWRCASAALDRATSGFRVAASVPVSTGLH